MQSMRELRVDHGIPMEVATDKPRPGGGNHTATLPPQRQNQQQRRTSSVMSMVQEGELSRTLPGLGGTAGAPPGGKEFFRPPYLVSSASASSGSMGSVEERVATPQNHARRRERRRKQSDEQVLEISRRKHQHWDSSPIQKSGGKEAGSFEQWSSASLCVGKTCVREKRLPSLPSRRSNLQQPQAVAHPQQQRQEQEQQLRHYAGGGRRNVRRAASTSPTRHVQRQSSAGTSAAMWPMEEVGGGGNGVGVGVGVPGSFVSPQGAGQKISAFRRATGTLRYYKPSNTTY